jgi:excinuclease UvrABC ATPase subunit
MSDIALLMKIIDRLVDEGNTAVVIEHNLDVVRCADWIIDLGPDGGSKGGQIVFEGTPKQLLASKKSLTGAALRGEF